MLKGWIGEIKSGFNLWAGLDSNLYHRFHDVIIPSSHGTTQVDHILVSPFGIFVVETKNYKGWIFGSADQSTWTQVIYKSKYKFQNPLRQTHRHKKVLSKYLSVKESSIQPVISFVGDVRFKTKLPSNVLRSGLSSYIKQFEEVIFSDDEVERITRLLSKVKSESKISKSEHIQSLKKRHSSNTICPKCGSDLVVRKVKQGERKGSQFLGCSSYPRCRFLKI
jgi:restriction system protein